VPTIRSGPARNRKQGSSGLPFRGRQFAKASFDQPGQGLDGRHGVGTARTQSECRTVSRPQRQQVEDAFAVDDLVPLHNFDLRLERASQLDEQVRGAGVESLRIENEH